MSPDISMCLNKTCPLNNQCYRYKAKPSEYTQSYCKFKPTVTKDSGSVCVKCENFLELR